MLMQKNCGKVNQKSKTSVIYIYIYIYNTNPCDAQYNLIKNIYILLEEIVT